MKNFNDLINPIEKVEFINLDASNFSKLRYGRNNINISTIMQNGIKEDNTAEIVVITEISKESDIQKALKEMLESDCIKNIDNLLRVMN